LLFATPSAQVAKEVARDLPRSARGFPEAFSEAQTTQTTIEMESGKPISAP